MPATPPASQGWPSAPSLARSQHRMHPVDDALDDRRRRLATACYYGLCTWVDRQVGRVIGALERTGLAETTRVVYTSDHGDNIGARGMWGKSTHYDDAAGVPLIMAGPGCCARARLPRRPSASSTSRPPSWRPSARTPTAGPTICPDARCSTLPSEPYDPKRTVFSEYHAFGSPSAAFMLRNGRYKYNYYVGYAPELFDLAADPGEERNLARRPGPCATIVVRLRGRAAQHPRSRGNRRTRQGRSGGADRALRRP